MAEELQEALDGFFLAAEYGRSDVIKALADHGRGRLALSDVVDPVTGRSPLHVAVASGKKDALRVLLAAGFPPAHQSKPQDGNASNANDNRSAYALAQQLKARDLLLVFHQFLIQQVAANDVQSVEQLLAAGVDAGVTDAATGGSLLHWAASCQAADVMETLLGREDVQTQKLVDSRNGEGATPLHLACHANSVECTKLLLVHHADATLRGDKGISEGKTALELATKPEVKELFAQRLGERDEVEKSEEAEKESGKEGETAVEDGGDAACGLVNERRGSGACVHEAQNGKLLLQLEEKDLLVNQLKKTIEALVLDTQEMQMLGEERVMLDYVRKLRDEKAIVQRQLEDANDYIKDQQQQLDSLKEQIRQMASVGKQIETDHDILSHTSDGTASSVAGGPPDSTNSNMSALDLHQLETQLEEEEEEEPQQPRAQPLKLDAWTSKAQRNEESEVQDEDGEVIMTV
ncbi:uncharacterized protein IUM83_13550 [Phytophthora cinnamomi]|uniref:uncharacterized protein n=1 Tax=Phytophthora cinnamomi TaxID=4785 RepID=UPI0035594BE9|nr:hypothetical protein IUM83_13550 [Phytophthora cinnamomi]